MQSQAQHLVRGQRDVLEPLAASEVTVFRRGPGIALHLGPDRFDLQFATKELAQDMQTPSKNWMMRLRRMVRYLLEAADVGPFFAAGLDRRRLERKRNDVQVNFSRCDPAGQPHDRDVERESASGVPHFTRE